ncbi:MAG TPA: glycerate kinase, partial [Acholeplasmataceae bacterium]|nr:glycerate kinase [Acholeplasmataceae bacterium]
FSPQKGATHEMVVQLEAGMEHYASILEKTIGKKLSHLASTGAAGGLGFALSALKNVKIISGIEYLLTQSHIEAEIKTCHAVFTGEGSIDLQSIQGKVPVGVGMLSKKHNKPVVVMVGKINCDPELLKPFGITYVYSINEEVGNLKRSLEEGPKNLERTTAKTASMIDFKE